MLIQNTFNIWPKFIRFRMQYRLKNKYVQTLTLVIISKAIFGYVAFIEYDKGFIYLLLLTVAFIRSPGCGERAPLRVERVAPPIRGRLNPCLLTHTYLTFSPRHDNASYLHTYLFAERFHVQKQYNKRRV